MNLCKKLSYGAIKLKVGDLSRNNDFVKPHLLLTNSTNVAFCY